MCTVGCSHSKKSRVDSVSASEDRNVLKVHPYLGATFLFFSIWMVIIFWSDLRPRANKVCRWHFLLYAAAWVLSSLHSRNFLVLVWNEGQPWRWLIVYTSCGFNTTSNLYFTNESLYQSEMFSCQCNSKPRNESKGKTATGSNREAL